MRPWHLLAFVFFIGCGRDEASKLSSARAEREDLLVVVMGGNVSCGQDPNGVSTPFGMHMYSPFSSLKTDLEAAGRFNVHYFLSCHTSDAVVHYATSEAPQTILDTDVTRTPEAIDTLYRETNSTRLILAGHSYGGWLAMKTAPVLAEKIDTLITIDPISRPNCTIFTPAGCTQAPTDIDHQARLAIHANATHWSGFYQTTTFYLHASVIPEADDNTLENVGHTSIDTASEVWTRMATAAHLGVRLVD